MLTKEETLKVLSVLEWAIHTDSCAETMMTDDIKESIQIMKDEVDRHKEAKIEDLTCPECGGLMVSRSSKHGTFWGCKQFPKCRGTRDSDGRSKQDKELEKTGVKEEYPQEQGFPFRKV